MPGETEKNTSAWTVDTSHYHLIDKVHALEKLVTQRFVDNDKAIQAALVGQEKAVAAALAAAKEAVIKAEMASDKRFDAANQVKSTFGSQLSEKLNISEFKTSFGAMSDKVDILNDRMNQDKGGDLSMTKIYGAIGAVGAILAIVIMLANGVFK